MMDSKQGSQTQRMADEKGTVYPELVYRKCVYRQNFNHISKTVEIIVKRFIKMYFICNLYHVYFILII